LTARKLPLTERRLLAEQWASFEAGVMPLDAPDIQRKEMRCAFYGGAAALYHILMHGLDPGTQETDADMAKMQALHDELEEFPALIAREAQREAKAQPAPRSDFQVPVPEEIADILRRTGRVFKASMPEGWGFAMLVFSYGEGGTLSYISSAERDDVVKVMREFIAKQADA
jgi:hypothetical protein